VGVSPLVLGLLAFAAGCADTGDMHGKPHGGPVTVNTTYRGNGPYTAVCTTGMVADIVRNIAGDRAEVVQLMRAGVDPHLYKASPDDVVQISNADIVFYSGLHLEGKMAEMLAGQARRKPAFGIAEYLEPEDVLEDGGAYDPHVWFDVSLWSKTAQVVADALVQFDPAHAEEYRERAKAYRGKLSKLHIWTTETLRTVPKGERVLVTAHDAFRYFGRAYDVEVRGIQGISTESEAGVKQVNELVDFLVERRIKAIFVETSVSERNVTALIEGCEARKHKVVVGGELFSDAMGKDGTPEGTYIGMVRHNVRTIVKALK
jgi:manganese/zinc/iron transport system substrate-binding protein